MLRQSGVPIAGSWPQIMLPGLFTPTLGVTFDKDVQDFVLATLPHKPKYRAVLEALTGSELLIIYLNWQERLIEPQPRQIVKSQTFVHNPLSRRSDYIAGLGRIEELFRLGGNLLPFLSTRIVEGYARVPGKMKRHSARPDLDMLLNDWGMHHLHLGSKCGRDGFVERTRDILIVAVKPERAYFVDIVSHQAWTSEHLARTVIQEWPDAGIFHRLNGALGLEREIPESERKIMRDVGMSGLLQVNGSVYMTSGYTSAGTSLNATLRADNILRKLDDFVQQVATEPLYVARSMLEQGILPPGKLDLHFEFFPNGGYGVVERTRRFAIRLA